jgi:hypothetical protein
MAEQRSTPEEKLLKLIEKEDGNKTVIFKRKRNIFFIFSNFWFSLKKITGLRVGRLKGGIREPNLKVLNKFLFVISILLLGYSVMDFAFNRPDIKDAHEKSRHVREDGETGKLVSETRPFLHYLEMVRRRNIFSPIALKQVEKPEVKKKQLQEMASDLGLVGISLDEEPMAMIEDKKKEKTFFLKKGDKIGVFEIEDILENKVILSFEGKKIELI